TAKILATGVAIVVAWLAHRWWTFREQRSHPPLRELVIFGVVNGIALGIQAGVLAVTHHGLGFTSPLADNLFAYGVGLPLGTIARYAGYKLWVFTGADRAASDARAE